MSLFCLGFGDYVDYSFLDVMSKENKGLARRIYEASDATLQLQVEDLSYNSGPVLGLNNATYFISIYYYLIAVFDKTNKKN